MNTARLRTVTEFGTLELSKRAVLSVEAVETDHDRQLLQLVHRTRGGRLLNLIAIGVAAVPDFVRLVQAVEQDTRARAWIPDDAEASPAGELDLFTAAHSHS